ncbi:hypothetical protein Tco_0718707 [Tanacetum coccineum]
MVEKRRVWELGLMTWIDQGYGISLVENVGDIRKGLKMKMKNEDDDEIKGLMWVCNHVANKREKSGHM